jgi:hypothetical protein
MVENYSQMLKGARFIWYYWTQKKYAKWEETNDEYIFYGTIGAFRFLNSNASQKREIRVKKNKPVWEVYDSLYSLEGYAKKQIWHPNSPFITIESEGNKKIDFTSYNSNYYGTLTEEKSIYFEFEKEIKTSLSYHINT